MKTEKQPCPTALKYKEGDTAIIRNGFYSHNFKNGTKVTIIYINDSDYRAKDSAGNSWWVADQNFMTKKELGGSK